MEMATCLVTAVLTEGQSVRMVTKEHGVSKTWRYELLSRHEAEAVSRRRFGTDNASVVGVGPSRLPSDRTHECPD
jgi:hypothetical protein